MDDDERHGSDLEDRWNIYPGQAIPAKETEALYRYCSEDKSQEAGRKQARKQARVAASVGAKGSEDTVEKTGGTMVSKTTVPKTKQGCEYDSAACAAS
ncbi:hypothetical protein JG687_00018911 [Phytophthora cactorum]|uniref:Uncharacterized protein n=1 Tax=Phytophthora cactorum TaxID=29920 RepID=A0A329RJT7_9STRA|nr:hypothetical protein Pcac1_g24556 [Phytophthora cactorum]KAG2800766.1 hypothetical protein PC112_g20330 [Phytophthora cactorum]KAG2801226.1 hypothetical protein PC111_g19631 [Phytophthora cactorum]KAG2835553.1 hypothetical protein PC113_g20193 [Phytophthora cactorum]KAG2879960.1 hypothetical protein PC114_g22294 [Phytophthora cactorum]